MNAITWLNNVLVVDDEENIRFLLDAVLQQEGMNVTLASSASEALEALDKDDFDLVLSDIRMPQMSGLELLERVQQAHPNVVVVIMSAYGTVDTALEAIKRGAYDYISKPFKPAEVVLLLRKAEERERLKRENARLRTQIEAIGASTMGDMVARSAAMQRIFKTIRKIAAYKTTVLIQGESGTGKELVAQALHQLSPRNERSFVAINCGAIPEALLESELFGHKKGAFTDATADKKGLFTVADGGTLFLDEVGELPTNLQVKLLRVLQEEEFRPVGDTRDVKVDVRVVAATVRDLESRRQSWSISGRSILPLERPSAASSAACVIVSKMCRHWSTHFIEATNSRLGTSIGGISQEAMKILMDYRWPGNVRELENTVEHAMVLAESDQIDAEALPTKVRESKEIAGGSVLSEMLSIKKATRLIEEQLIRKALKKTKGNRTGAAKLLEISHRALLYKIKSYEINDL